MRDTLIIPAEAYAHDADGAGLGASAQLPEWVVQILARLIHMLLRHLLGVRARHLGQGPSWWHDRPDLPAGSSQAEAASVRGAFGNSIAWMCLRRGIGPGHPDWPELSRAIVAFGGSIKGFRPGLAAFGLEWWENPNVFPGMIGMPVATPGATAVAALLARHAIANTPAPSAVPNSTPVEAGHARLPVAWLPAPWRHGPVRPGTGPPTGPPGGPPTGQPCS